MPDKQGYDYDAAIEGITESIKDYGDLMGERSKIQASMLSNQIKASQNELYKQQERERERAEAEQFISGYETPENYLDILDKPQPSAPSGVSMPTRDQQIKAAILRKQRRGEKLDDMDRAFLGEKEVNKATQDQLDALGTAVSEGSINTIAEAEQFIEGEREALELQGVDIDYLKERLTEVLPEQFEAGVEERGGFLGIGAREGKPERRQKDGVWYERREDNLWHPIQQ